MPAARGGSSATTPTCARPPNSAPAAGDDLPESGFVRVPRACDCCHAPTVRADPDFPGIAEDLTQIKDPSLALVTSLELAREKQDTSYLDSIIRQHKYSKTEIDSIKADIYQLAHKSKLALNKLKALKLDVPEFSPKALDQLENTNIFTLVPVGKN